MNEGSVQLITEIRLLALAHTGQGAGCSLGAGRKLLLDSAYDGRLLVVLVRRGLAEHAGFQVEHVHCNMQCFISMTA